jgi:hypothetical protein
MSLQRKFQEMELEICEENCKLLEDISLHHGIKVLKLTITSTEFEASESFSTILRNFPNLEELKIDQNKLTGNFTNAPKVQLLKLQKLQILDSSHDFLQNLHAPKLKSLSLIRTNFSNLCLIDFLTICPCSGTTKTIYHFLLVLQSGLSI